MKSLLRILNIIGYFTLAVFAFILGMLLVSMDSPCSTWAVHPSECSSDIFQNLGK
jgi:hypothetical protein